MSLIETTFEPRIAVLHDGNIIGGVSRKIDEDNIYNFDIGILDAYQGIGISKALINKIIDDAIKTKVNGIKAQVVNRQLFDYLLNNGFSGSVDSGIKYIYKDI